MSSSLGRVSLAELRALAEGKEWLINQAIADLHSLTPVRGHLRAVHHGTALEVTAEAEAIVTLCCARCLQQFNHVLRADVRELIEFRGSPTSSAQGPGFPLGEDWDDRLDPAGSFDPERWLFEQLSLELPLVNRCGEDCPGPPCWGSAPSTTDPRWEALKGLSPPPTVLSSTLPSQT